MNFLVFADLLFKDWEMLCKRRSGELHTLIAPEVSHCLCVESNVTEAGSANIIHDASCSGFGDYKLRHGGATGRELKIISIKCAIIASIDKLTTDERVNITITNKWRLSVPEVKCEDVPGVLSANQGWEGKREHVVIKETVHDWAHHISENILTNKVDGVLDNNNSEVDELMHDKGSDRVVMVQVGLSEVNVS